jgi:dolichol-phosphate mannosyltransferase
MLSIVIPTFNERDNVFLIAGRISDVLSEETYEIIFIDDSNDDTPEKLEQLIKMDPHVRYEHRTNERGLGTAVVRGFELALGDKITVMDADLQHPPEMLVPMLEEIESGADIVIPSRFVPGGDDGGLNVVRKLISATARYMGKIALKALRPINDPTSGFFMFRQPVIKGADLNPIGWKILIEVLVRGNYEKVVEIPYRFHARAAGESKMSLKEQWNYIRHLINLAKDSPQDRRFYLFAMVGISGLLVNMVAYAIMTHFYMTVVMAGTISAIIAMNSNFYLNNRFTWSEVRDSFVFNRYCKFLMTSIVGIVIDVNILSLLYYVFDFNYLLANLIGILAGTIWNYIVNNAWTWRKNREINTIIITSSKINI